MKQNPVIKGTRVYGWNRNCRSKIIVNIGGARSSKSYSVAQLFIYKMFTEKNKRFLILRKTLPSLKISTYRLFIDILSSLDLYRFCTHNKTERIITLKNSFVHFTGLDDPEKIKSTEWNYIWMEEANEFSWEDFITLKTRLSAQSVDGRANKLFLTLNPVDQSGWIRQKLELGNKKDISVFRSSYKDNNYLSTEYINLLEGLKEEDEDLYKIYTLGEWISPKNLIFINWKIIDRIPENCENVIYGLDFGFNNPTCLLRIVIADDAYYIEQLIYESRLTNNLLIERMLSLGIDSKAAIYADASEPARIEELSRHFCVYKADKNVSRGIDLLKRRKLRILHTSVDVINEIKIYKWRQDRNGIILDEPVKFNDHAMDAMRYAVYTHSRTTNELRMFFQ